MRLYLLLFTVILISSCKSKEKQNDSIQKDLESEISPIKKGEVSVLTQSMEFITADTLMSGWNTLIYENNSSEVHFLLMDLYPVGLTIAVTNIKEEPDWFHQNIPQKALYFWSQEPISWNAM